MLTEEQRNMIVAATCIAVLIAVAFFASYAGMGSTSANEGALTTATCILAFTAIIQAALFIWQLRIMERGLKEARQEAKFTAIAADAANKTSDAAVIQANAAKDTLTKLQRPYIYVFGVERLEWAKKELGPPFIQYIVANYGQTPAEITYLNVGFADVETIEMPGRADADNELVVSPVLPSNHEKHVTADLPSSSLMIIKLHSTGLRIQALRCPSSVPADDCTFV
jgi:hypothetical protein